MDVLDFRFIALVGIDHEVHIEYPIKQAHGLIKFFFLRGCMIGYWCSHVLYLLLSFRVTLLALYPPYNRCIVSGKTCRTLVNRVLILQCSACSPVWKVNSSRKGQNVRHFADDTFKCIFVNEKFCILMTFVPKGKIDNNQALVWIMASRRIGDKPLSEPMLDRFTDTYMRY